MNATPREIWHWLTAGAFEHLRAIQTMPLDTPISYWTHVVVVGWFWITVLIVGLAFGAYLHEDWRRQSGARERERRKREAEGKPPILNRRFWWSAGLGLVMGWSAAFLLQEMHRTVAAWAFWLVTLSVGWAWYKWGHDRAAGYTGRPPRMKLVKKND